MKPEHQSLMWFIIPALVLAGILGFAIWCAIEIGTWEMEQARQSDNATSEIPWEDIGSEPFTANTTPQAKLISTTITITPKPAIITVFVNVPIPEIEFESVAAFKAYVDNWVKTRLFIVANDAPNKCELWAKEFKRITHRDGYDVNFQESGGHAINSTHIGNECWYLEPQTGEVWFWGYLD